MSILHGSSQKQRDATEPMTVGAHIRLQVGQVVLGEAACRYLLQQGLSCLLELLLLFHAPHPAKKIKSRGKRARRRQTRSLPTSGVPKRTETENVVCPTTPVEVPHVSHRVTYAHVLDRLHLCWE